MGINEERGIQNMVAGQIYDAAKVERIWKGRDTEEMGEIW